MFYFDFYIEKCVTISFKLFFYFVFKQIWLLLSSNSDYEQIIVFFLNNKSHT